MKKILVATDASDYSRNALRIALKFVRKFNTELELLFVINDKIVYEFGEFESYIASPEQMEREGELAIKATLEGIDVSDINFKTKILHGNPGNVIIQEIAKENIDLVVMGSHGYGALVGSIIGSVSQKVLHGAKCSVLIAK